MNKIKITKLKLGFLVDWGDFAPQDAQIEAVPFNRLHSLSTRDNINLTANFTDSPEYEFPVSVIELDGITYEKATDLITQFIS